MASADSVAWVIIKLVAWALLFAAAAAHVVARARVRSRGWQLNRAIVLLLSLQLVVAALDAATTFHNSRRSVLSAFAATYDIADAAFLALLMARARRHRRGAPCALLRC
jgi:uncharacterized membrane protein YoaK (UPF0700 family)